MTNLLGGSGLSVSLLRLKGNNIGYLVCITAMAGDQNERITRKSVRELPRYCSSTECNSAASFFFLQSTLAPQLVLEATAVTLIKLLA